VAIINEAAARRYWPDSDPIGDRLQLFISLDDQDRDLERTVVGVVRDSLQWSLDRDPEPFVYVPFEQYPVSSMYVMARTHGDAAAFAPTLRELVRKADPELALYRVGTLDSFLDRTLEQQRFSMALLTGFAAVALVLGCVGIYGLIAFSVARRTREIGLRMALGATGQRVLGLVLAQTTRMVLAGVVVGVSVSLALTRYIDSLLHEVSATDPLTLAAVTGLLVAFSLVAGLIPARRASAVEPAVALRSD
jgi:putative ABC transport system permease protein